MSTLLVVVLALAPRASTEVATTRHFAFHSDERMDLHDALNRLCRTGALHSR